MLFEQSTRLAAKGHAIRLITRHLPEHRTGREVIQGVEEIRCAFEPKGGMRSTVRTWRQARRHFLSLHEQMQVDCLNIHQPFTGFGIISAAVALGIPRVYTCHSLWAEEYLSRNVNGRPTGRILSRICAEARKWIENRVILSCHRVVVLSRYTQEKDPFETYNRAMFNFNDALDRAVVKPLAEGYVKAMPRPGQMAVDNFFNNLDDVAVTFNDLLQLKFKQAANDGSRVVFNTTFGLFGLIEVTSRLEKHDEDFGQTLGHYGLGGGFHVVLPLFGPSNVRDTCGKVADWFLDPVHYIEDSEARAAVNTERMVNAASLRIGQYEALTQDSLDLYILLRDSYESNRNKNIRE